MKDPFSALSVNFHLWEPCNMRCKFCYATFQDVKKDILPKGHLPEAEALQVVDAIVADGRFSKITFAGGEPTLCRWLPQLIARAKVGGLTTMVVTNGSKISKEWLDMVQGTLDWVALSIDSVSDSINRESGRAVCGKEAIRSDEYLSKIDLLREYNIRIKINTVVHALNQGEDMNAFLLAARPERWKVLQVLPVSGQNDGKVERLLISPEAFAAYTDRHRGVAEAGIEVVPEDNEAITGSYLMIDPAGRFFDNTAGRHSYSKPILDIGLGAAIQQIRFDRDKFEERGGLYDWKVD
jgi:radical S-adenosyl methionine domain-containing protein 2